MDKTICELFAGVGGFRLGFDKSKSKWQTVWFNQWEPKASKQHAHNCYIEHFGNSKDLNGSEETTCIDISLVDKNLIPDHSLLVAGFPCQDYSVAHSLSSEKGIQGKKGVLWWQIYETLVVKKPHFCLFENVDRLVKSPSKQRGRDFGIMLSCLNSLGYSVEWRIINAATYGNVQRRKRIFIFAFKNDTEFYKSLSSRDVKNIITKSGFFAQTFPVIDVSDVTSIEVSESPQQATESFCFNFSNAGVMINNTIYTASITEKAETPVLLKSVLEEDVDKKYYISKENLKKWQYLKGAKKIPRIASNGHKYIYSEGPVSFPDDWEKPARTMLTSEATINRSSHAVKDPKTLKLRTLTPVEAERIQGFDDDWTNTGMTERMRFFCMGNALVVPLITRMAKTLNKIFKKEK